MFVVETLLVQAPSPYVRAILGMHFIDLMADDIVNFEELVPPEGLIEGAAIPVRLTLKTDARLGRIGPAHAYSQQLWRSQLPFTLACRPEVVAGDDASMKAAERAFFSKRGLLEALS